MITWLDCGEGVWGSERMTIYGYNIAFGAHTSKTLNADIMVKGGVFKPLSWKENLHMKAEGVVSPYDGFVSGLGVSSQGPRDTWIVSNGVRAADGTFVFSPNGQGCATRVSASSALLLVAGNQTGGGYLAYAHYVRESRYVYGRGTVYYWRLANGDRRGCSFGRVPDTGWIKSNPYAYADIYNLMAAELSVLVISGDRRRVPFYDGTPRRYYPLTEGGLTQEAFLSDLRHYRNLLSQSVNSLFYEKLPELEARSFDQVNKFDGNMLAFCSELNEFGKTIPKSLIDLFRSPGKAKDIASFWLSSRYGDRLSYSDLADLIRAFDKSFLTIKPKADRYALGQTRQSFSTSFGDERGSAVATGYYACRVAVSPKDYNALMRSVRRAYEWDYYPSLGNMWDMIPLSFVVDWIVNVSEIFESVDRMVQARYYDVAAILLSVKAEARMPGYPGVLLSFYDRSISHSLNLGVSSVKLGLPSAINIVDGISLLLS